jgi:REP element-mobilizing transposase RayT
MFRQPLVIAYHLIWTAYGWWLPNDPRGSGSRTIRSDILAQLGELHFGRKKVQPAGRVIREFYAKAATLLRHALVTFDDTARQVVATAFAEVVAREKFTCWACVIMPDHVHSLIRKHRLQAEAMIERLKAESAARLRTLAPRAGDHPVWGGGGWKVFLDHPDEARRTATYVERNPDPYGLPRQSYPFVQPYDGWPLHPGHSPTSPYAKALKAAGRYPH